MATKPKPKRKINSRAKGKCGELDWKNFLIEHGFEARRGQQFSGGKDSPDVVSNLPFHWEVKRTEKILLYAAFEQAVRDAAGGMIPVVAHRKNNKDWVVILSANDFIMLYKELIK